MNQSVFEVLILPKIIVENIFVKCRRSLRISKEQFLQTGNELIDPFKLKLRTPFHID